MELNISSMRYYVSTEEASFFNNNKMEYANNIPTTGDYNVGDFVVSSTQSNGVFGWVCTVAGNPGEWEVIGSGAVSGSGGDAIIVGYVNTVSFSDTRSTIAIGIDAYDKNNDFLEVHYNGLLLVEGVHYNVSADGKNIETIGDAWNQDADDTQVMIFRVLKSEGINVRELKNTIEMNSACYEVDMGIDEYNPSSDIIEVHLNGVLLVNGLDYNIVDGKLVKVDQSEAWNPYNVQGQKMFIKILKNKVSLSEPIDGSVNMDKLADDVKQAIEAASDIDITGKQDKTDNNLATNNKTVVGAINELFQNANNGKELIASAIGEPLDASDTFSAMSDDINGLLSTFKTNMMNNGIAVEAGDKFKSLIDKIATLVDNVKSIFYGYGNDSLFIVKNDGSLWACGNNNYGQLGLGDSSDRNVFTQVTTNINNDVICGSFGNTSLGGGYSFIVKNDGSLWACGRNRYGQLGLGDSSDRNTFTQVTTNINNDVKQVACTSNGKTYLVKNDGSLWICTAGSILDDVTTIAFNQVSDINNVKEIICGNTHVFILKNDGSLWACGNNAEGQLGLGNTTNVSTFTQVTTNINNDVKQIACGRDQTFILKNDGSLWACGDNEYGQLGLGDINNRSTFTQVTTNINNDVKQIACGGGFHTFILKNDGSLWACGNNTEGQLGLGTIDESITNTFIEISSDKLNYNLLCLTESTFIIKNDGSVWACGANIPILGLGLPENFSIPTFIKIQVNGRTF